LRIGIHTSIAGSIDLAAMRAAELGANTFQIFSASPRSWRASPLDPDAVARLKEARKKFNLRPLVVHDNYLINLAAPDRALRERSIAAFRAEILRSLELGAEYLVFHPGSCRNHPVEEALRTLADSLAEAAQGLVGPLMLLIENTAGSGAALGSDLKDLAELRKLAIERIRFRIGFCLDTAHLLAAGYDVATAGGLEDTLRQVRRRLGLARVKIVHLNDSRAPLGSHIDRHAHIGRGYIGIEGFRRILQHPGLRDKAFILETPIERPGDDRRNLLTVKRLCRKSCTTIKRSK